MSANLVENLVDADHNYLKHLNSDIIIGIVQIYDYLPIPEQIEKFTLNIIDRGLSRLVRKSEPAWLEAKEAAHNPDGKKCYESELGKLLGDFVAKSELGYFKNLSEHTWLGQEIVIPDDTDEIAAKMLQIPLCR